MKLKEVEESSSNELVLIKTELNKKIEENEKDYHVKCEQFENKVKEYQQLIKDKDNKVTRII